MRTDNNHIIHKQLLKIDLDRKENSSKVHDKVKGWYYNDVVNVLQEAMDEISRPDEFIFIDDLHIDLGTVSFKKADVLVEGTLEKILKEAFQQKLQEASNRTTTSATFSVRDQFPDSNGSTGIRIWGKELATVKAFLEYLEKGVIPIWYSFDSIEKMEAELQKYEQVVQDHFNDFVELAKKKPYVLKRLVYQFSEHLISFIIQLNDPVERHYENSGLKKFYEFTAAQQTQDSTKIISVIQSEILRVLFHPETEIRLDFTKVIDSIRIRLNANEIHEMEDIFVSFIQTIKKGEKNDSSLTKSIGKYLASKNSGNQSDQESGLRADEKAAMEYKDSVSDLNKTLVDEEFSTDDLRKNSREISEIHSLLDDNEVTSGEIVDHLVNDESSYPSKAGYYINNAGLVLLSPYLEMFLGEIGLVNNKNFINGQSIERAVNLLHYLSHGNVEASENDLILNKLICGLSIHEPVKCDIVLSPFELQESENLLNALIRNWSALGKTSPDGLREGFLRREGVLNQSIDGWKLTVEQRSLDVLMSSIPWGFNVVKMPWMEQPVFVKWT